MSRALSPIVLSVLLLACESDDSPDAGSELSFAGKQSFLAGFSHDTGYQPPGSPVQVKLVLSSGGDIEASARGQVAGSALQPVAGSGTFALKGRISVLAFLKVDMGGKKFEGPLPADQDLELSFGGSKSFEPFLLQGQAPLSVKVPNTRLATIPLAGALSGIPGVKGDLTINAGADLDSSFAGTCAALSGGVAQDRKSVV